MDIYKNACTVGKWVNRYRTEGHCGLRDRVLRSTQLLKDVAINMSAAGRPTKNGYAERLIRTIKEEEITLTEYDGYADAREQIGRFLDEIYQHKRIHSALGYLTPAEFERRWTEHEYRTRIPNRNLRKTVQI